MTEAKKIEKLVKDKVQENVNEIVKNALQEANLKDLICKKVDEQIEDSNKFAKLINNLTQSQFYNNIHAPITTVKDLLASLETRIIAVQTLKNDINKTINQDTLNLLKQTKDEAINIKNDLSDFRDQAVNGALFLSFEERAKEYDTRAQKQERWSIRYLWVLGVLSLCRIIYFFRKEYCKTDLLLNEKFWISLLLSGLFAALLYILSHLSSNKYHMNKKLAEEYWHKASILKSFVGYKTQYQQNMEDAEYKVFFEYLVKAIMLNPADKINVFLNKKLPIEKILDTPKNIVEGAKDLSKNIID